MHIDKNIKGVSFYYKVKAFGLICQYVLIALFLLGAIILGIIKILVLEG